MIAKKRQTTEDCEEKKEDGGRKIESRKLKAEIQNARQREAVIPTFRFQLFSPLASDH
jgi:hypothetical protein